MLLVLPATLAHQPRIVFDKVTSIDEPITIEDPEISKAYYGELRGRPDYYKIVSNESFNLYINILAPDQEGARTDFIVEVIKDYEVVYVLNGPGHEWQAFFEEFARDNYLKGPEFEGEVTAGTYYLKISNEHNKGRYSLAVGNIESFPFKEIVSTYIVLPRIKKEFFEKPAIDAFVNIFGLFLLIAIVLAAVLVTLFVWIKKKKKKK